MDTMGAPCTGKAFRSVYELAMHRRQHPHASETAFDRLYEVTGVEATCRVGAQLASKYGMSKVNSQFVVSIRNRWTFEQTWFNADRKRKPQNFMIATALNDPTEKGKNCDFCDLYSMTAEDDFGRVERSRVKTGSNLFKCCGPGHGLLVFDRHHPLDFDKQDIRDLMSCTQEWLDKSAARHPDALYPLFVWNCLARAGASQFHGHAQVMLSPVPFPCYEICRAAKEGYEQKYSDCFYLDDLFAAYSEAGLMTAVDSDVRLYPSLTPWKDMKVVIWSNAIVASTFHEALHTTLRVLMEEFGMQTFNVGIHGIPLRNADLSFSEGVVTRIMSRGKIGSQASDFGGLEVVGGASVGHTDPFEIASVLKKRFQCHSTESGISESTTSSS